MDLGRVLQRLLFRRVWRLLALAFPVPPEGDCCTRLLERWEEVRQRIEKLDQPKEPRNLGASSAAPSP